jgi:hypothetical protein
MQLQRGKFQRAPAKDGGSAWQCGDGNLLPEVINEVVKQTKIAANFIRC